MAAYRGQRRAEAPVLTAAEKVAAAERCQLKAQQDADNRVAAQQKRELSATKIVRVAALSPVEKKGHIKAATTTRARAKPLREAAEVVTVA